MRMRVNFARRYAMGYQFTEHVGTESVRITEMFGKMQILRWSAQLSSVSYLRSSARGAPSARMRRGCSGHIATAGAFASGNLTEAVASIVP